MQRGLSSKHHMQRLVRRLCLNDLLLHGCSVAPARFCSSSSEGGSDKDLVKEVFRAKEIRNKYPKFDKKENRKPDLSELLKELRAEKNIPIKSSEELSTGKAETWYQSVDRRKVYPQRRVEALYKHADISSFKSVIASSTAEGNSNQSSSTGDVIDEGEMQNTAIESKEDSAKPLEKKKKAVIPDDSEVGNLMKMLMEKRIKEEHVTDIMARVKMGPKSIRRSEDRPKTIMKEGKGKDQVEQDRVKKINVKFAKSETQVKKIMTGNLFSGPRSHYFDELFKIAKLHDRGDFVSRHEIDWQEKLENSVQKEPPSNSFEEMMLHEDKLWPLPVDNEVGLDEENDSTFEDHVFLDHHLDLFPETGNLRRFMELVVTGLQQNPYLSVEQKTDTIYWFKEYFDKFPESDLEF